MTTSKHLVSLLAEINYHVESFVNGFEWSLYGFESVTCRRKSASNKRHGDHILKSHREREKNSHRLLVQKCLDGIFTKTLWHTLRLGGAG